MTGSCVERARIDSRVSQVSRRSSRFKKRRPSSNTNPTFGFWSALATTGWRFIRLPIPRPSMKTVTTAVTDSMSMP